MLTGQHQTMPPRSVYVLLWFLLALGPVRSSSYQTRPLSVSDSEENSQSEDPGGATAEDAQTVVVKCHEDSVEVVMRARLLGSRFPMELVGLRLGPDGAAGDRCDARLSADGDFIIQAPLAGCGSKVMFTESDVLHTNLLLLTFIPPSTHDAVQVEAAAVPVMCKYKRRFPVSSGALRPTWTPLISIQSTHLSLDFQLRLMTDDWSTERSSPVYFMDQKVNIQASLDHHHPPPLRLYAGSCVATLTPDVNSHPRYPFIDHQGCFTDSQLSGSGSRFLPRIRDKVLQIQLDPFLFHQDHRHTIYITCYLEAVIVPQTETKKKACSFTNERWRSVEGDDDVCESCNESAKSGHMRAHRSKKLTGINELQRGTTLGPIIFLPKPTDSTERRMNLSRGRFIY